MQNLFELLIKLSIEILYLLLRYLSFVTVIFYFTTLTFFCNILRFRNICIYTYHLYAYSSYFLEYFEVLNFFLKILNYNI